jgi:hypothetical protein
VFQYNNDVVVVVCAGDDDSIRLYILLACSHTLRGSERLSGPVLFSKFRYFANYVLVIVSQFVINVHKAPFHFFSSLYLVL